MANPFKDVMMRLERQKASIEKALAALSEVDGSDDERESFPTANKSARTKRRRKMSAEVRQRMAAAQQKRWAAKRAGEAATKKTVRKGTAKKAVVKAQEE